HLCALLSGAGYPVFAQGISDLIAKALNGDGNAQVSLGESYRLGIRGDKNYAEALRFYKLAAEQGIPEAQFALAEMYRFGEGIPPNYSEAVRLYKLAAARS